MPRPMPSQEKTDEICKAYLEGGALNSMGKLMNIAPLTIRKILINNGIDIRPKHITITNHFKGKDFSGINNPSWKGGNPYCETCGKQLSTRTCTTGLCKSCYHKSIKNENNPNRKNISDCKTDESKIWRKRQEYKDWRNEVFNRDEYKCQICNMNTRDLVPHHLNGFDKFIELRFDVNNGITLCKRHHIEFHTRFGFGRNTLLQFIEFNNNYNQ
jgi:hypothetical protein